MDPPTWSRYPATPTSSAEAFHDSVIAVCPTLLVASLVGRDGAVVSTQAVVVTLVFEIVELRPEESKAETPSE